MSNGELTLKQEAFVQAYLECGNGSEAYRRSYNCKPDTTPQVASVEAAKLMAKPSIALAIETRRAKVAEKVEITLMDIAAMLKEAHEVGKASSDASAMTEASMSLAKLLGHYTEKKHVTSDNRNHNVEERLSTGAEWLGGLVGPSAKGSDKVPRNH
jgi:phage terminase small subunit